MATNPINLRHRSMKKLILIVSVTISTLCLSQKTDSCKIVIPEFIYTTCCDYENCNHLQIKSDCKINSFQILLYNRYGEIVYQSIDPEFTFAAENLNNKVYICEIRGTFDNKETFHKKSTILIIN